MPPQRSLSPFPQLAYGTPRKLPRAKSLPGRVVVLDVAFAANAGGASFEGVTKPFLDGLGSRLAMWIDHHDHEMHAAYADDPRFVLHTKAEHGACPELVTPERVAWAGELGYGVRAAEAGQTADDGAEGGLPVGDEHDDDHGHGDHEEGHH